MQPTVLPTVVEAGPFLGARSREEREERDVTERLRSACSRLLYRQAEPCGISKGTLLRAAAELGVKSHKTGFDGGWEMRWPPPSELGSPP